MFFVICEVDEKSFLCKSNKAIPLVEVERRVSSIVKENEEIAFALVIFVLRNVLNHNNPFHNLVCDYHFHISRDLGDAYLACNFKQGRLGMRLTSFYKGEL